MTALVRLLLGTVICAVGLLPSAAVGQETEDDDTIRVRSRTTVKASGHRLFGRVAAPFVPEGEAESDDCERDRDVDIEVKTKRGFRSAGHDFTSADGTWSVRVKDDGSVYRIRVRAAEFGYSPEYGEMRQVRCLPATVVGRRGAHGFRILSDQVLGVRFGRGAGRLAATGLSAEVYAALGLVLIAGGFLLVRKGQSSA